MRKKKMIEMMKRQTIAIDKLGEALILAIKNGDRQLAAVYSQISDIKKSKGKPIYDLRKYVDNTKDSIGFEILEIHKRISSTNRQLDNFRSKRHGRRRKNAYRN